MAANSISAPLEKSLLLSIDHYRVVLKSLEKISKSLTASDIVLTEHVHDMASCQQRAQEHDGLLLTLLTESGPEISVHPLYLQRKALLEEVIELNHLLLPKINGMMALISHELTGLKNGRVVLGGYKQTTHKHGRLVKSSV